MGCCGRKAKPRRTRGRARFRKAVTARQLLALRAHDMMSFLMCKPTYYGIDYTINPWMDKQNTVDPIKAIIQWNTLSSKIKELGARPRMVKPQKGLPDMVFTANAGLVLKDGRILLSHFAHPERAKEEGWFDEWFTANKFQVTRTQIAFEGAGDALYLGGTLVGGYGFRSDKSFYEGLTQTTVKLIDPHFYHLDTCFCPLDNMDYLIWPGAFESDSLALIRSLGGNELAVSEDEARLFACNAVRLGRNVILPAGCEKTTEMLVQAGYQPHPLPMSEFIKSGGACKCLTLAL